MGSLRFLPSTVRARLALAGALTILYILASTLYIRQYPSLELQPQDLHQSPSPPANDTEPAPPEKPRILLASSFFPVPNPQFTDADYDKWLPFFLGANTNDIYLFTTPELEKHLAPMRGANMTITFDTSYASPLEIPPLKGKEELYQRILKKDRAKTRRSVELYANRHAKPFFLQNAVSLLEKRGLTYQFAFWVDAGSFKSKHVYRDWPSPSRLEEIWEEGSKASGTKSEDMIFVPVSRPPHKTMTFWTDNMGPIENDLSIASFFGGTPNALHWWTRAYYAYHDYYLSLEVFIGRNQALINVLLFLFPERFITVWYNDPDAPAHLALNRTLPEQSFLGQCSSERSYYQFWLADDAEREAMQQVWIAKASAWRWWGWWVPRDTTPCQTTRVLPVLSVLRSKLGDDWKAPTGQVNIPDTLSWD